MDFTTTFESLFDKLGGAVPSIITVLAILIIGYFVAKVLQRLARKILNKTGLDNRIAAATSSSVQPEKALSKLVYYIVMIFVLMAALDKLGIDSVIAPLRNMVDSFMAFIPNIVAAALIGFVGYVIAKIASGLVGMATGFLEGLSKKAGLSTGIDLTNIIKNVVFIIVFIPILIAALDALNLNTITDPAKEMLETFIAVIPRIIAAVIIIGMFYIGGKFITGLLKDLLASLGTDKIAGKLQLSSVIGEQANLSNMITNIAFFFLMFLGVITGLGPPWV